MRVMRLVGGCIIAFLCAVFGISVINFDVDPAVFDLVDTLVLLGFLTLWYTVYDLLEGKNNGTNNR